MKPRTGYNPKREIAHAGTLSEQDRVRMANRARYGGNPEHKRQPGDYGLTPPASPRPGKALCDGEGPFPKAEAGRLLQAGFLKGLVSSRRNGDWPKNVWAVSDAGVAFEGEIENPTLGVYHGYPMPAADAFRNRVIEEWNSR